MKNNEKQAASLQEVFTFNPKNTKIRVQLIHLLPWFVAKDVCNALGIEYYRDAIAGLDEDERGWLLVDTLGGKQKMASVNESGLYSLIFQSRKPEAKSFRKWVTSEVLPSIRQTGSYEAPAATRPRRTRGELVNAETMNLLWLIGESLQHGDQKAVALQLGVSVQAIQNTLNGYNRSPRILMALYNLARANRETFMLYHQPAAMAAKLQDGSELPVGNHMPAIKLTSKRGAALGNQNARRKGVRK